jgi:hypothetical protein
MGEHKVGDDITIGCKIGRLIEWLRKGDQPLRVCLICRAIQILIVNGSIAKVFSAAELAGNVPAAPTLIEGRLLIVDERFGPRSLGARCSRVDGAKENAGYAAGSGRDVALGAVQFGALKGRVLDFVFVEEIKDGSLLWVEGDDLNCFSIVYRADVDIVVEVERSGVVRGDLLVLKTGLGEDKSLGVDWDLEQLQHRLQVTVFRLVLQAAGACRELAFKLGYGIAEVLGPVVDRSFAERYISLIANCDLSVNMQRGPACQRKGADH